MSNQVTSRISGTGMFVPPRVVSNQHFASYLDTSDEWIRERTGIVERRWAEPGVAASNLAEPACRQAMAAAGVTPEQIGGIIVATATPDHVFPSTACALQKRLGVGPSFAFDLSAACSGFVYALVTADSLISKGLAEHILVVGAEVFSQLINPQDRGTCILFGDGAGAVVLSKNTNSEGEISKTPSGILGSVIGADGNFSDILSVPAGGSACPISEEILRDGKQYVYMAGREVFKVAVRYLAEISERVIVESGYSPDEVKYFVCHQANKRILQSTAKYLNVAEDRFPMNMERYGNTSAASVPILLAEIAREGKLKKGDLILMNAFGGGVTWGATLVRW